MSLLDRNPSTARPAAPYRVCFVCTGNICRSPVAESVLRSRLAQAGLADRVLVDSAGTGGWHEGNGADPRTVAVLAGAGYATEHTARRFRPAWFAERDLVLALDRGHARELRRLAPSPADAARVRLLRSYEPGWADGGSPAGEDADVPDPYYGGPEGFDEVLEMIESAMPRLLDAITEELTRR
ncbi:MULTISPECIES: low molecular weight protein-tyrosine-phosphatase [unclassified Streptomyces]|uniref:low molecular weight protein-tyrosine-phosphatase n=1 Tax=unclassified Streptomyces TaxID=2593676 RepID=UPI0022B63316|nr:MULTISPECIES: low molecular weight protein-tyrosine-phosphatase [unclassified Streptomyces]MCZ7417633.1 low molecular weight phosphotyrosine protein phosphatase [Streptomyces sp. WMMC897]MCZ7432557.1 low molecular weight phosphotyrosine protein phosphatase [Streptomyces sp. WMMC1477]